MTRKRFLQSTIFSVLLRFDFFVKIVGEQNFASMKFPVGVLLHDSSNLTKSAFWFQLEKHNSDPSSVFKLDVIRSMYASRDEDDNFQVIKALCSTVSNGTMALLVAPTVGTASTVDAFARTYNMPYVTTAAPPKSTTTTTTHTTTTPHSTVDPGGFSVHLRPFSDQAITDIIKHYRWEKIFYVYDTSEGLYRLESLHRVTNDLEEMRLHIEPMRLLDISSCYVTLRQIDAQDDKTHNKYIVVDLVNNAAVNSFFRQIQAVGMNRLGYHYLLTGIAMEELDLAHFRHGGVNITGFSLLNRTSARVQTTQREWLHWHGIEGESKLQLESALMMDAVSTMVEGLTTALSIGREIFQNFSRRGTIYNNVECKQKPVAPWNAGMTIMTGLRQVKFDGVTGEVAFDENGFRRNYRLAVYELSLDSDSRQVGYWDSESGLHMSQKKTEKNDLEGIDMTVNRTRIITTILSVPFLDFKKKPDDGTVLTGNNRFEGYCADLAREVAAIVDFDYELRLVKDNAYGSKSEFGTWNGMVGELTRKEADVGIAPLTITSIRERVIDFSKPFMNLGISIMIKKPEKQKPGVFSFMDPLAGDIWMCIVISYLGVSFVLFLVSRFSPYEWQIEDKETGPSFTNDFNMLNSLWFSLGAFMRQGCDISPRSLSGRVVGSAWWFFTLIMISSYTANLAAFLTVERMLTPIQNVDDLAKQTEIMYGTLNSGSTKDFFRNSKISIYERMWDFMSANPDVFVQTTEEGVTRVRSSKGKYAFLLESTMNDYYNQRRNCNTMKVGSDLDFKGYGIATPIGSDLREEIGLAVLQLLEKGTLQKLHKRWWYDKGECLPEDAKGGGSSQSALTLSNVAGIFYILIGGLGLSMVMSLLEFIYKSRREIVQQKRNGSQAIRIFFTQQPSKGV